jgi:hypothetical protein
MIVGADSGPNIPPTVGVGRLLIDNESSTHATNRIRCSVEDLAEVRPDAGTYPSPILMDGLWTMRRLDLLQPPVQELPQGRSEPIDLPRLSLGSEAPQRPFRCRRISDGGLGDLTGSAAGRLDAGENPHVRASQVRTGAPHRACTIGVSPAHNPCCPERGHNLDIGRWKTRKSSWRSARVDESDGLENRCGRKVTVGSNPTSSA